jgi:diguanylate cyclase (GGDEF)-like protein
LPGLDDYKWRLGRITLIAALLLTVVFAAGAGVLVHHVQQIRRLAEDTRSSLMPQILERQRAVVNIERLKQYGMTVFDSGDPQARADSVVIFSHLVKHPAFQGDPTLVDLLSRAEQAVINLAKARQDGDRLRAAGQERAAVDVERIARQDWRDSYSNLDTQSDLLVVGASNLGSDRSAVFDRVARYVQKMVVVAYAVMLLALLAAGLLVYQLLLKPILLTTATLDRSENVHPIKLPVSVVGEIDLFYRSVERMTTALAEIEEAHRQARAAQAELRRLASIDELTGVANRRWFTAMAGRELERCRRFHHPLALLMIDVDHFKRVNDTHGHAVGDEVLKAFTRVLESNLRSVDLLGRLGGEEFAVILPEAELAAAMQTGERLRGSVEALRFPIESGKVLHITASVGIAILNGGGESLDSLLARADAALYAAKGQGRNRVVSG